MPALIQPSSIYLLCLNFTSSVTFGLAASPVGGFFGLITGVPGLTGLTASKALMACDFRGVVGVEGLFLVIFGVFRGEFLIMSS